MYELTWKSTEYTSVNLPAKKKSQTFQVAVLLSILISEPRNYLPLNF